MTHFTYDSVPTVETGSKKLPIADTNFIVKSFSPFHSIFEQGLHDDHERYVFFPPSEPWRHR